MRTKKTPMMGIGRECARDRGRGAWVVTVGLLLASICGCPKVEDPVEDRIDVAAFFETAPTAGQVAEIDSAVTISIENDPTATGGGTMSPMERRIYQVLLLMKRLEFTEALPWTDRSLFDWFTDSVGTLHFLDTSVSYFSPGTGGAEGSVYIRSAANMYHCTTDLFIDRASGGGLFNTLLLFVHEARHAQKPHSSGSNDLTLSELGAWGCQYYACMRIADGSNLALDAYDISIIHGNANSVLTSRIVQPGS